MEEYRLKETLKWMLIVMKMLKKIETIWLQT